MEMMKKLRVVALIIGMAAVAVPALAGNGRGPGNGSGGARPLNGTGNGAKKGACPQLSAVDLEAVVIAARNGRRGGGGYGPGDGSGGGTRPQDGTGNGAKRGTCVKS